jgi:DNA (cytosine-5)-methyltransferase 1
LGWEPKWFSEIEQFPSAVLKHHYPNISNMGDMTKHKEWKNGAIDLLVGGTPCQSFSVAGLRKGLDDPRGNLMLTYLAIAEQYRAKWLVWENVPGVLSSNGGKDFGAFLGALGELGYGFAYRVLDAQYFGVPQRRKRVFVVGCLGDWPSAAAVLFESHSLQRHSAPRRQKGQKPSPTVTTGAPFSRTGNEQVECDAIVPFRSSSFGGFQEGVGTLRASRLGDETLTIGTLDTQCGFQNQTHQTIVNGHLLVEDELMGTLTARMFCALGARDVEAGAIHPVYTKSTSEAGLSDITMSLTASMGTGGPDLAAKPMVCSNAVRRLTPTECERLQGFPDNHTQIPYRNKEAKNCPDSPRYKAMGNSMAVPVMKWIGQRIQMVKEMQ